MSESPHHTDFEVVTIYESNPEPLMMEDGYEVQVARMPNGAIHSLVITDYVGRVMVEMPPEVALAIAKAITDNVGFPLSGVN
ncbi:hypothetical protein KIKIMORA_01970 [Brevundimonas phage vB_BpoS-Kikimora]|uniref:Uncharacterized protein n=2 Tax=Kikimoravirus TaxID=3425051 RepID=A0A9E7SQS9_9CAUD|nr:hypothetical protein KIKIMORA_01970 [Brevundimonas phage vB_BpoS-Kikimora]UTC28234.1 hypothetical protein GURKE_02030 [Brevundimonas phage vB_BpoS-Gurke]